MRRRLLSILILLCTCAGIVRAQYDARLSQYFMAKPYYNPAVAGATEDLNILALARLEMIGVHGAPKSFFITADMPLALGKTNHGVGLVVFTEAIGLFQNTHVGAQYAYKYKLFGGVLSGGLQIGLVNQSFDGTKVIKVESEYHQETDAAIPVEQVSGMGL
ncbi:PorP/SprF family type IX secretion system membrane protein, partial [Parabacteroides distasonis]